MSDEKKRKRTRNGKKWGKKNEYEEEGIYGRRRKENEVAVGRGERRKMKEKKNFYSCHCTSSSYYVLCRLL